jgi:CheY-like chemotaxis protein
MPWHELDAPDELRLELLKLSSALRTGVSALSAATADLRRTFGVIAANGEKIAKVYETAQRTLRAAKQLTKSRRVLVVDDDAEQRMALAALLCSVGLTVRQAATASEARTLFRSFAPHVLVSDISMPDEDGYELLSSLRRRPGGVRELLFAVAITAAGDNQTPSRAVAAGFDRLLSKPLDFTALLTAVREG